MSFAIEGENVSSSKLRCAHEALGSIRRSQAIFFLMHITVHNKKSRNTFCQRTAAFTFFITASNEFQGKRPELYTKWMLLRLGASKETLTC